MLKNSIFIFNYFLSSRCPKSCLFLDQNVVAAHSYMNYTHLLVIYYEFHKNFLQKLKIEKIYNSISQYGTHEKLTLLFYVK